MEQCTRTLAINYPCALGLDHTGACQPDPEGQLRIYGITVERLKEIQRDLHDARRYGLVHGDGAPTSLGRYVLLRANLERLLHVGGHGVVSVADIRTAIARVEEQLALPS